MRKYICVMVILFIIFPINVSGARGCCSWHGGISYCGSNNYYICNDGTESPSCTCNYKKYYSNDSEYELTDSKKCDYDKYNDEISTLESQNKKLREVKAELDNELESTKTNLEIYKWLFWFTLAIFIVYYLYIKGCKVDKN